MKKISLFSLACFLLNPTIQAQQASNSLTCVEDSSYLQYHWSSPIVWTSAQKTFNSFDANGYVANILNLKLDASYNWQNNTLSSFTNSPQGKVLFSEQKAWQASTNSWLSGGPTTFSYNSAGFLTQWFSPSMRTTNTYNPANDLVTVFAEIHTAASSSWTPYTQTSNTYDQNHNLIYKTEQAWDTTNSVWKNSQRVSYTSSNNRQALSVTESWYSNAWHLAEKDTFIYNGYGIMDTSVRQFANNGGWLNAFRVLSTYDQNSNKTKVLVQVWDSTGWHDDYQAVYFHACAKFATVGIKEQSRDSELKLFPNPSSGKINLTANASLNDGIIELSDISGRLVRTVIVNTGTTTSELDLGDLNPGIYFCSLISQSHPISKGRIILSR